MPQKPPSNRAVFLDPNIRGPGVADRPRLGGEIEDAPIPAAPAAAPAPAPKPAESAKPSKPAAATPETVRGMARSAVTSLFARLRAEAGRRDNVLTIDDLAEMEADFDARARQFGAAMEKAFVDYVREHTREPRSEARQFPFDRIIVHQFSHQFVRRARGELAYGALSRRVLPGFLIARDKMLGEEAIEDFQERARRIVARYAEQLEADGNWQPVYVDGLTQTLILDALVAMAPHFRDFPKRLAWFVELINGHLPPGDAMAGEGPDAMSWELGDDAAIELLSDLFRRLVLAMTDLRQRKVLAERYGREAVEESVRLIETLRAVGGRSSGLLGQ